MTDFVWGVRWCAFKPPTWTNKPQAEKEKKKGKRKERQEKVERKSESEMVFFFLDNSDATTRQTNGVNIDLLSLSV